MVDPAFISAGAGFLGAIIGAGAALRSQHITQGAITERERLERVRKEERVSALFATRLIETRTVARFAADGSLLGTEVADAFAPLAAIADDASLMLWLTPDQIYGVAEAVASTRLACKVAAEPPGEAKAKVYEQQKNMLSAQYSSSFAALNKALVQFGRKAIPPKETMTRGI